MKKLSAVLLSTLSVLTPLAAHASGFALNEESATVLGTAYAGAGVTSEPAVQFSNPAGIAGLKGDQLQAGGTLYRIDAPSFKNRGTTTLGGLAATGNSTGVEQITKAAYGYYTHEINDHLTLGLGMYAPFGLVTGYDSGWVGRYSAIESHVNTTEISPVLAYKINDQFSVGGGPTVRYTEAKLTQAIDFGTAGSGLGGIPQAQDGAAEIEGDGIGFGFKFGGEYKMSPDTKFGLGYRSRMTTRLSGETHYSLSSIGQTLSTITGQFKNTHTSVDLNTPQSVELSASHHLTQPLTLYGDVLWTGWNTFQDLEISNDNAATNVVSEKWRNTFRFSVGGSYDVTDNWTARLGYSYDQSPVKGDQNITARVPDGDRNWLAIGAGYKINQNLHVDAAYDHLFIASSSSAYTTSTGTLNGTWNSVGADLFTIDATYSF